jgi:hypothetical protein
VLPVGTFEERKGLTQSGFTVLPFYRLPVLPVKNGLGLGYAPVRVVVPCQGAGLEKNPLQACVHRCNRQTSDR